MQTDLLSAKHIASVLKVAECQSFSQAAWQLFFTESAVSKHVAYAEKLLGIQIFRRSARGGVALTPEGAKLIPYLQTLQDGYSSLDYFLAGFEQGASGVLLFASPCGFSSLGEDQLLARFCGLYPNAKVSYAALDAKSALSSIQSGKLDLAMFATVDDRPCAPALERMMADPAFSCSVYKRHMPLLMTVAEGHPAIHGDSVELDELRNEVFIFKDFPKYFLELCRARGFEPKLWPHNSLRDLTVFEMVAKGGFALPLFCLPAVPYRGVRVLPLAAPSYTGSSLLFYRTDNFSPVLRAFLEFLKKQPR